MVDIGYHSTAGIESHLWLLAALTEAMAVQAQYLLLQTRETHDWGILTVVGVRCCYLRYACISHPASDASRVLAFCPPDYVDG